MTVDYKMGDYPSIPVAEVVGRLVEGYVSHTSASGFWLQRDTGKVAAMEVTPDAEEPDSSASLTEGSAVLGWWEGAWYRGVVLAGGEKEVVTHFLDWGNNASLARELVRPAQAKYKLVPPLAIKCRLKVMDQLGDLVEGLERKNYRVKVMVERFSEGGFVVTEQEEGGSCGKSSSTVKIELETLLKTLANWKKGIEVGLEALEDGKRRGERRKEILLKEMKTVLVSLSEVDKNLVKEVKGEVLDNIRMVDKSCLEIEKCLEKLKTNSSLAEVENTLDTLKEKSQDLDTFILHLNMSVALQPGSMAMVSDKISDAVFLYSPVLNPKHFFLEFATRGVSPDSPPTTELDTNHYFLIRIHASNLPASSRGTFIQFILQRLILQVSVSTNSGTEAMSSRDKLEESSLLNKMKRGQAELLEPGPHCLQVHVKRPSKGFAVTSVKLLGSNIVNSPLVTQFNQLDENRLGNMTVNDTAVNFNQSDLRGLDESDLASLDLTVRRQMVQQATLGPLFNRVSRPPNVSSQREVQLNDTTPFSPRREGVVSTMRGTGMLASAFSQVQAPSPTQVRPTTLLSDDSILAPSRSSGLSLDEIQRSLSSIESEAVNKSVLCGGPSTLDKSVTFAPRTEVCQFLMTPQVKENGKRYQLEEGQTKEDDGQAGLHKKLLSAQEDLWGFTEQGQTEAATLPLQEPTSDREDDPHLMLNASKAPTPDSILDCWGGDDVWDNEDGKTDEEAGVFSPNTSLMPDTNLEQSLWEGLQEEEDNSFNLRRVGLVLTEVYEAQHRTRSSTRGFAAPCSITYVPQMAMMLISEPQFDRIGVYEASKLTFRGWLKCPGQGQGSKFNYPTSVLCLANGFVVILERNKLHILNPALEQHQPAVTGKYHGLTEDGLGGIWTLTESQGKMFAKRLTKRNIKYTFTRSIEIKVLQNFSDWESSSKCRFIGAGITKLFITDMGLHKFYILDLATNTQTAHGYLGSKDGQFKSPTGILVDEADNLLVADNENDRLVVFSSDGRFVRTVRIGQDFEYGAPYGLVRHEKSVLVVMMGRGDLGAVARLSEVCIMGGSKKEGREEGGEVRPLD